MVGEVFSSIYGNTYGLSSYTLMFFESFLFLLNMNLPCFPGNPISCVPNQQQQKISKLQWKGRRKYICLVYFCFLKMHVFHFTFCRSFTSFFLDCNRNIHYVVLLSHIILFFFLITSHIIYRKMKVTKDLLVDQFRLPPSP